MKRVILSIVSLFVPACPSRAQTQEVKFIADTLMVQAEASYEADPDLATLNFHIATQEKELRSAFDRATQSMQRILQLAERSGLPKEDVSVGALTVVPIYDGKRRTRSYLVDGQVVLRIRDFSRIGSLIDNSVQEGIVDFRSLTYSLADEEAAKERAVAQAMSRAVGRARAALEQKGQKVGALRYASLDVKQLVGVARLEPLQMQMATVDMASVASRQATFAQSFTSAKPGKIAVTATIQCIFQIQ